MKVEKIDHIALRVGDLEKAMKFFTDLLGTEFGKVGDHASHRQAIEPFGLEVVQFKAPREFREGVFLIGLKVPNLEEATAEMESRGMRLIARFEREQLKAVQFNPEDSYGVLLELLEYPVKHPMGLALEGVV